MLLFSQFHLGSRSPPDNTVNTPTGSHCVCRPCACWSTCTGGAAWSSLLHNQPLHLLAGCQIIDCICYLDEFRTFDWWSDQTWTSLVGSMSAFGQQRSSGFQRWWGIKCLIFFPCFQNSFIQVNFVNLEKVEVLALPGGEGELRVRGDKTVRSHNPLKLTGSRSFYISSSGL